MTEQPLEPDPQEGRKVSWAGSLWERLQSLGPSDLGPVSEGNAVRPLMRGDRILETCARLIGEAKASVHLEIYTWAPDATGLYLLKCLQEAQKRGVQVLGVVDYLGSWEGVEMIRNSGLDLRLYHPIGLRLPWRFWHRRNHRKLLVVDSIRAVVGSANWADTYNCTLNEACYRDLGIELWGPVVADLEADFQRSWRRVGGLSSRWEPSGSAAPQGEDWIHGIPIQLISSLNGRGSALRRHLVLVLRQLRSQALIVNPYFVPDPPLLRLLRRASRRGVALRILVPGDSDHPLVQGASRATFGRLLRDGARIFECLERMVHAKTAVLDGQVVVLGSANLDARSFKHNLELNLVLSCSELAELFLKNLEEDLQRSQERSLSEWETFPAWRRACQRFLYLFWWWL